MARRKKQAQAHENHERWLVSYADFITLLFAFFVVMYSVSSVNEGKYRVLSDALNAAFRDTPKAMEPIQVGEISRSPFRLDLHPIKSPSVIDIDLIAPPGDLLEAQETREQINALAKKIEAAMGSLIDDDLVNIRQFEDRLEVEIKTSILFTSGSARAAQESEPVLQRLADVLSAQDSRIVVEGFTDDRPINTLSFPSNWELSSARAATVVRLFARFGIAPERMAAVGYAQFRPIAQNDTAQGRAKNRRVVLVIMAADQAPTQPAALDTAQDRQEAVEDLQSTASPEEPSL